MSVLQRSVFVCLCVSYSWFTYAGEKGTGTYAEVVFGWGVIAGAVGQLMVFQEGCNSRFPGLAPKLTQSFTSWSRRNNFLDEIRAAVYARALAEGGSAEALRLSTEIVDWMNKPGLERMKQNMARMDYGLCTRFADKLDSGVFDLGNRYPEHLRAILGTVP